MEGGREGKREEKRACGLLFTSFFLLSRLALWLKFWLIPLLITEPSFHHR